MKTPLSIPSLDAVARYIITNPNGGSPIATVALGRAARVLHRLETAQNNEDSNPFLLEYEICELYEDALNYLPATWASNSLNVAYEVIAGSPHANAVQLLDLDAENNMGLANDAALARIIALIALWNVATGDTYDLPSFAGARDIYNQCAVRFEAAFA